MKNVIIAQFESYNQRRYSAPWVCLVSPNGRYDFSKSVGTYTGNAYSGEAGDLVVHEPVIGQVYGYGQKDRRGNQTMLAYAKWDGSQFVPCDKIGRDK